MNVLPREQQITIIGCLTEGKRSRATERLTGIHRDTIMRLGESVDARHRPETERHFAPFADGLATLSLLGRDASSP